MIKITNATKIYENGARGIQDINLTIEKGEFAFIVGTSGSGKSTLMRLLLKEIDLTEGEISINNENITYFSRKETPFLRRKMGIVFQDFRLIPSLNVYENVAFALRVTNVVNRDIRSRVPYVLKLLGLAHKAKSMPDQISGGEQQRVALARALVNNPAIIIADEPTGNIDPELSYEILDLLCEINEQAGTTILMVTHEQELITHFNKRIITLEGGVVISDAHPGQDAGLFTGQEKLADFGQNLESREKALDFMERTANRAREREDLQMSAGGGK